MPAKYHFRPEQVRGYAREQFRLNLLMLSAGIPNKRIAVLWEGKVLTGTESKHRTVPARKGRTLFRLKQYIAARPVFWSDCPCEVSLGEFDHDWQFQDDSFDHEFGTERVHYWRCAGCGEERGTEPGDYDDDGWGQPDDYPL